MNEPTEDPQPAGDPRRAYRCRVHTTLALYLGVAALIVIAASSTIGGTSSPLHGYVGLVLIAGMVLFVAGCVSWLLAMVLRRDPAVRLAWASADAADCKRRLAELEVEELATNEALAAAAAEAGITLVPTGDGGAGFSPKRSAPDRATATTSS